MILSLKTTIKFLYRTLQLMMMYHPIKCGCKKIGSSVDMVKSHTWLYEPMTLNLKTANQLSCKTLWPMMMLHHTKFGYKRLSNEEIVHEHSLEIDLFCDLDFDHNRAIQSFHKTIQLMIKCHQTKSSCKRINSSDNILP